MNGGNTQRGQADGFAIDILPKLSIYWLIDISNTPSCGCGSERDIESGKFNIYFVLFILYNLLYVNV